MPTPSPLLERYALAGQRPRAAQRRRADGDPHARATGSPSTRSRWRSGRPQAPRAATGLQDVRDSAERERIRQALDQTDWNVSAAARLLGTERTACTSGSARSA